MTPQPKRQPQPDRQPQPSSPPSDIRSRLLSAATELAAEVGYHNATTRLIARRAGVAEGSIYRHFPDKPTLFLTAAMERQQDISQAFAELPARAGSSTVQTLLTEALTLLRRLKTAVLPLELAIAATPQLQPPQPAPSLLDAVTSRGGPPKDLADYLTAEQRLGRIRPDLDPTLAAVTLLATLAGLALATPGHPDAPDATTIHDIVSIICHGLNAPPDDADPPDQDGDDSPEAKGHNRNNEPSIAEIPAS